MLKVAIVGNIASGKTTVEKFIEEKGNIRQIDFSREYNNLPGISYVVKDYGTLNELKKSFGITDVCLSLNHWNRAIKFIGVISGVIISEGRKYEWELFWKTSVILVRLWLLIVFLLEHFDSLINNGRLFLLLKKELSLSL